MQHIAHWWSTFSDWQSSSTRARQARKSSTFGEPNKLGDYHRTLVLEFFYTKAVPNETRPNDIFVSLMPAEVMEKRGQFDDAATEFIRSYVSLGCMLLAASNRWQEAGETLRDHQEKRPRDVDFRFMTKGSSFAGPADMR